MGCAICAFNDEAIPPKIARDIARIFPPTTETGWNFTGLVKFEKFFDAAIFAGLARKGTRSLYVGLESASERVLALMRKKTKQEIMHRNLADATRAGTWMHCFLFFGFPGEREEDAQETFDFIVGNSDIIASFGCSDVADRIKADDVTGEEVRASKSVLGCHECTSHVRQS